MISRFKMMMMNGSEINKISYYVQAFEENNPEHINVFLHSTMHLQFFILLFLN